MTGNPTSRIELPPMKVGLVGPSSIGKTSILTALIQEARAALIGTAVSVEPEDDTTARVDDLLRKLRLHIHARHFNLDRGIQGSDNFTTFNLSVLAPGNHGDRLALSLLDYPGSWLTHPPDREKSEAVNQVKAFLRDSDVLLVPTDATLVMQWQTPAHRAAASERLSIESVERVIDGWAKARKNDGRPGAVVVVPVRAEKYLADNGGARDDGAQLEARVLELYGHVLKSAHGENSSLEMLYCPIDTMGCVELGRLKWGPPLEQQFVVRGKNPTLSPRGGGDVFALLVKRYLDALAALRAREAAKAAGAAKDAVKQAQKEYGFFKDLWYEVTGDRDKWKAQASTLTEESRHRAAHLAELGLTLDRVSKLRPSGRIKVLPPIMYAGGQ